MIPNHYYVGVVLKEISDELLERTKIESQLRALNNKEQETIDLLSYFRKIKISILPGRMAVIPSGDCAASCDCQVY